MSAEVDSTPPKRRRRRGRRVVAVTAAVLAAAGVTVAAIGVDRVADVLGFKGFGAATADTDTPPPATVEVRRETLEQTQDADGELGYGPAATASSRKAGTVTDLPDGGDVVKRGKPLYELDDEPTTLLYGTAPAWRDLTVGTEGKDVKQLEANLRELGYRGFTADTDFDANTAAAVRDWQDDLGLAVTGEVRLGQVVFADGAVRVDGRQSQVGAAVAPGAAILSYTGTDKVVTVELDAEDENLAVPGEAATVALPDGEEVDGEVFDVSSLIRPAEGQQDETETVVQVLVAVPDSEAVEGLDQAAVTATFTADERADVLTVPVTALIALSGGGYGVEVVTDGRTEQVAVETGLFAAGRVEITGPGITAGTVVGVPE